MRTAVTHNALVRAIHDTTKQEGFAAWAQAQDCYIGDLPLVPFASDVRFL